MILGLILLVGVQATCVVFAAWIAKSKELSVRTWVIFTLVAGPLGILALLQLPLDRVEPVIGAPQDAPGSVAVAPPPPPPPPPVPVTPLAPPPDAPARTGTIIQLQNVTVSFEGFKALKDVNFYVDYGELRVVIGPNGAGKTTLIDVITGKVRPESGRVIFGEETDLLGMRDYEISNLGIGRKFQTPTVFANHSVRENLELSLKGNKGVWATLFARLRKEEREKIDATLDRVGLSARAHWAAGHLSHGEKQWLEIAMLMMQDPKLLLLDEPVAGMTDEETAKTGDLIQSIAEDRSVLVVEHDMEFVRQLNRRVTVLHEGQVLCEGPMEMVQKNPRVIEVYLGRDSAKTNV